jgi:hypothetical protein
LSLHARRRQTDLPFVLLLEALWGVEPQRLAIELRRLGVAGLGLEDPLSLNEEDRAALAAFADFLASRLAGRSRRRRDG